MWTISSKNITLFTEASNVVLPTGASASVVIGWNVREANRTYINGLTKRKFVCMFIAIVFKVFQFSFNWVERVRIVRRARSHTSATCILIHPHFPVTCVHTLSAFSRTSLSGSSSNVTRFGIALASIAEYFPLVVIVILKKWIIFSLIHP